MKDRRDKGSELTDVVWEKIITEGTSTILIDLQMKQYKDAANIALKIIEDFDKRSKI